VIKGLLISNVATFVLAGLVSLFTYRGTPVAIVVQQILYLFPLQGGFMPWQLFTYMFMHGGLLHLLLNMLILWFLGMELENLWGSKKFFLYYLICGVGAGLSTLFIGPLFGPAAPTVGASGAIYGILIAFGFLFPDRPLFFLFLPIPIRARFFVMIYIGIELYSGIFGTTDGIAHFAHLGGAAVGFILLMIDRGSVALPGFFRKVYSTTSSRPDLTVMTSNRRDHISDASYSDIRDDEADIQKRIDDILDKISVSGYQNLTEEEKRILFDASKKLN
jgi:membrane associated rhomboid family serine protease